jgi:hypothetical protein
MGPRDHDTGSPNQYGAIIPQSVIRENLNWNGDIGEVSEDIRPVLGSISFDDRIFRAELVLKISLSCMPFLPHWCVFPDGYPPRRTKGPSGPLAGQNGNPALSTNSKVRYRIPDREDR